MGPTVKIVGLQCRLRGSEFKVLGIFTVCGLGCGNVMLGGVHTQAARTCA